jgi:hypothetical protein
MRSLQTIRLWVAFSVLFLSFSLCAEEPYSEPDIYFAYAPLFAEHSPLQVTIEAPLKTLMNERPDKDYLQGTFSYTKEDGTQQVFDLKLRSRGNFRRQKSICNFPPIRLNFRKKQLKDTIFHGQNKLKLVTHCQQNKDSFEQLVLREYLAYRILQVLTPRSFGVRLMHINYVDTEGRPPKLKYGFVLEDDDDVADRNGMNSVKRGNVTYADLDRRRENLVNVFQYLIGNTDFSLIHGPPDDDCCHNSMLLSKTKGPPYTPLPFDFDFSGLVNAPYAAPNPRFRMKSVRSRLYRGLCSENYLLPETFRYFLDKRDAIYAIVDELDMLSSQSRRSTIKYLDTFYETIADPKLIESKFAGKCVPEPEEISR